MEADTITEVDDDDIYFKFATADRSVFIRRGYSNNNLIGNTNNKKIASAFQRAGITYNQNFMLIPFFVPISPALCLHKKGDGNETN